MKHIGYDFDFETDRCVLIGYGFGVENGHLQKLVAITNFETRVQPLVGYDFEQKSQVSHMTASYFLGKGSNINITSFDGIFLSVALNLDVRIYKEKYKLYYLHLIVHNCYLK